MVELDIYPSFITVDGGEGGTGATFQELEDGVGLPLLTALPIVSGMLEKYGIRDKIKIFASGKINHTRQDCYRIRIRCRFS